MAEIIRTMTKTRILPIIIGLLFLACGLPPLAHAQKAANPHSDAPLEITAKQTLEWHRNDLQYVAKGDVVAKQGDVTIMADTLTADYRETKASAFEIYRLTANGNVKIISQGNTATGGRAVYDVDNGVAVMTGSNLRLTSPDQMVTARDSFEYWVTDGRLSAIGSAKVLRGQDTLDADKVTAIFTETKTGNREIKSLNAEGNVIITTPTETLTGKRGEYVAATNTAEIFGDVTIRRGPNILEGERAEVNLTTNISKMHGGQGEDGRVRGVFYPSSKDAAKGDQPQVTSEPPAAPKSNSQPRQYQPRLLGQ